MTINEEIQQQLEKLVVGEKLILTAKGCSPAYIRNCVALSPHGKFSVKTIKGTDRLEVSIKEEKKLSFQSIESLSPEEEPDISIGLLEDLEDFEEDDFRGL